MDLTTAWNFTLLVLGFGFVVFFHELGHFLAAKWAGVKVEQFAVGFGQAILAWRKGIGARIGTTRKEYEKRVKEAIEQKYGPTEAPSSRQIAEAEAQLGLGETEYRINWIPLGGYVKMLGQDDLKPNAEQDDPRAYNRKSIGARMVIVSAGVVMNIILAAILFMGLFRAGFHAPAPVVGSVIPGSPAQVATNAAGEIAPIRVGDTVLSLNGTTTHDYTKIALNAALLDSTEAAEITVRRTDGTVETLKLTPQRRSDKSTEFLALGIGPSTELRAPDGMKDIYKEQRPQLSPPEAMLINEGDTIVAINGQPVADPERDYQQLHAAMQAANGRPVELTIRGKDGNTRTVSFQPRFTELFASNATLNFLGMVPGTVVAGVSSPESPAFGKLRPNDRVMAVQLGDQRIERPTMRAMRELLQKAGAEEKPVDLTVQRGDQTVEIKQIVPTMKVERGVRGLGVVLSHDEAHAIVGGIEKDSAAQRAGIPERATITSLNGQPVQSWYDVHRIAKETAPGTAIDIAWTAPDGQSGTASLSPTESELALVQSLAYTHPLQLRERQEIRKTTNLAQAAWWGVTETRDFVLQFYVTLKRMFTGEISPRNMMGPLGIFHAGTKITERGYDWLVWFLAMISANLAVVNFLPIPIVDGGLFTFLLLEKIQGKPLSPRAQSIAQVVGLALLLGIFLLVTYQDITRLFQI